MKEENKARSLLILAVSAVPSLVLGLWAAGLQRLRSLGVDEEGLETLEYGLLILMGVIVLLVAINALGGAISAFFARLVQKINSLG